MGYAKNYYGTSPDLPGHSFVTRDVRLLKPSQLIKLQHLASDYMFHEAAESGYDNIVAGEHKAKYDIYVEELGLTWREAQIAAHYACMNYDALVEKCGKDERGYVKYID